MSHRTMRRWRQRLEKHGYTGLRDQRKGKASFQRVPLETVEKVLELHREKYFDLNMRHFHEKLREEHQIELSYTWVQPALQGARLVAPRRRRETALPEAAAAPAPRHVAAYRWEQAPLAER